MGFQHLGHCQRALRAPVVRKLQLQHDDSHFAWPQSQYERTRHISITRLFTDAPGLRNPGLPLWYATLTAPLNLARQRLPTARLTLLMLTAIDNEVASGGIHMPFVKAFIAGFVSTLVFHQGLYTLFWLAGAVPNPPFALAPTWPLGVPAVLSLAFWGGLWGLPVWAFIRDSIASNYWLRAVILGALGPSAVALFIVFPIKGMGLAGGWDPTIILGALLLNGAWGFGVALFMRWAGETREP